MDEKEEIKVGEKAGISTNILLKSNDQWRQRFSSENETG